MDMHSRISYGGRLFLWFILFLWSLVACCIIFQYIREKQFKVESLEARLQDVNISILKSCEDLTTIAQGSDNKPFSYRLQNLLLPKELRVTILTSEGEVLYDNTSANILSINHLDRPEIVLALKNGKGYCLERRSESNGVDYFYSARKGKNLIVRCAVPYTEGLVGQLKIDSTFLWFMCGLALIFSILGFFATSRIGRTIRRLNLWAEGVEKGNMLLLDKPFPKDELGSISEHIIRLYARLQLSSVNCEAEHRAALREEQEKIRIKKQLTNNINHELKTPVAAIQVCLETIMAHPDMEKEKREEFISRCSQNVLRLKALLEDVSTLTRLDDGAGKVIMEQVSLNKIVGQVLEEEKPALEASGFAMKLDLKEEILLRGNGPLLCSAFANLVENAINYSGGSEIKIRLEQATAAEWVISFTDNGVGIPKEHLPYIFERFYRIDSGRSRRLGGTGLGLSIVKNVILLHGGQITATNTLPSGLQYIITLPR